MADLKTIRFLIILFIFSSKRSTSNEDSVRSTTSYAELAASDYFVDKTALIEHFVNGESFCLITAPPGFGKSVNLDMLQAFLSVEIDRKTGRPIDRTRTKHYKLFGRILSIGKLKPSLVDDHYAVYPVIRLNFERDRNVKIRDYRDALNYFKSIVHRTYREHSYLTGSDVLSEDDKNYIDKWLTTNRTDTIKSDEEESNLESALPKLSEFLRKHFDRGTVVLVDDYDSVIIDAIISGDDDGYGLNSIAYLYAETALKICRVDNNVNSNNGEHTRAAVVMCLMTGTLNIVNPGYGLSGLSNVGRRTFLSEHRFVPFYGFVGKEVETLFKRLRLNKRTADVARVTYDGYVSQNDIRIYRPDGLVNFLSNYDKVNNNNNNSNDNIDFYGNRIFDPVRTLASDKIIDRFTALLKKEPIEIRLIRTVAVEDLNDLRNVVRKSDDKTVDMYFSFLYYLGYLTITEWSEWFVQMRVPNERIKLELADLFARHYETNVPGLTKLTVRCARILDGIKPTVTVGKNDVERLGDSLKELFVHFAGTNNNRTINGTTLERLLFLILTQTERFRKFDSQTHAHYLDEYRTKTARRLDIFVESEDFGTVIEFEYDNETVDSLTILKRIFEQRYYTFYETFPAARNDAGDNGNNEPTIARPVKYCHYIGVCVNNRLNVSVSYMTEIRKSAVTVND